jgi:MFS family permease
VALQWAGENRAAADRVFSTLYVFGFLCGIVSTWALARVPEPRMAPRGGVASLRRLLAMPLGDRKFRHVLRYLASWQFAVNIAGPFFTVYFVRELGLPMSFVLVLTLVSQLSNAAVVRAWGKLSDRFANKSVLAAVTPLNLLAVAGVAFAGEFDGTAARMAYLTLLHMVMGACGAGIGLATNNIVIKLSPGQAATSYMATNALVVAVAAGTAPIVGGWLTDFFARRQLALSLDWTGPGGTAELFGFALGHFEFFFLISAAIGLYALHRLTVVDEPGAVEGREVVEHIVASARQTLRNASSVAGVRQALAFPADALIKSREGTRYLVESVFERQRNGRTPDVDAAAVGALLDASFLEPLPDDELDALLRKLDARAG